MRWWNWHVKRRNNLSNVTHSLNNWPWDWNWGLSVLYGIVANIYTQYVSIWWTIDLLSKVIWDLFSLIIQHYQFLFVSPLSLPFAFKINSVLNTFKEQSPLFFFLFYKFFIDVILDNCLFSWKCNKNLTYSEFCIH